MGRYARSRGALSLNRVFANGGDEPRDLAPHGLHGGPEQQPGVATAVGYDLYDQLHTLHEQLAALDSLGLGAIANPLLHTVTEADAVASHVRANLEKFDQVHEQLGATKEQLRRERELRQVAEAERSRVVRSCEQHGVEANQLIAEAHKALAAAEERAVRAEKRLAGITERLDREAREGHVSKATRERIVRAGRSAARG